MKILFIFFILVKSAYASFDSSFIESFNSGYTPRKCGPNITSFVGRLKEKNEDISKAKILIISNKGYSLFLLINAEFGRNEGIRPDGRAYTPGQQNWYHHVILENEGKIYDFDFGNSPEILSVEDYFEKMFLNESENNSHPSHKVGREVKLKDYEIKEFSALELSENRGAEPINIYRMGEYLKKF